MARNMTMKEHMLNIDKFDLPEVLKGNASDARLILNLIRKMPNSNPKSPKMGFGIEQYRFEFMTSALISDMQNKLTNQIKMFLPELLLNDVLIKPLNDTTLVVGVEVNSGVHIIKSTKTNTGKYLYEFL